MHICIKLSGSRGAWAFHELAEKDGHLVAVGVHLGAYDARLERAIVLEIHEGCYALRIHGTARMHVPS